MTSDEDKAGAPRRSALRVLHDAPYLRNLAWLVLLGTTSAALVDYLFKAQAIEAFGRGDNLLRFFALYYAATSVLAFALQTSASRMVLERFGLAVSAGTPAGALLAGSVASLVAPGFGSLLVARGGESVFRSSFFRAGYELFYTPIPAEEKRAAKTLIDVGFDRLGDGVGGGAVRLAMLFAPVSQSSAILSLAIMCSAGALWAASRLNRGYLGTLASSLVDLSHRAGADPIDAKTTVSGIRPPWLLGRDGAEALTSHVRHTDGPSARPAIDPASLEPEVRDILGLRSRDRRRVVEVLSREDGLTAGLVPHAITLLAWDQVADHALFALRKVAEERIGQLVDALLDPNQDFAVRRRLARVFSVCVSQRAASGLMFGLDDPRFDVRFQSARSLAAIVEKNPLVQIDSAQIFAVVLREVAVGRGVWESRRLLDGSDEGNRPTTLDEFVRTRAGESLAHVFTLLSLVLPREPLQIAFRSLLYGRRAAARDGAGVSRKRAAAGDPPAAVALHRAPRRRALGASTRRSHGRAPALEPFDRAEPRRAQAARRAASRRFNRIMRTMADVQARRTTTRYAVASHVRRVGDTRSSGCRGLRACPAAGGVLGRGRGVVGVRAGDGLDDSPALGRHRRVVFEHRRRDSRDRRLGRSCLSTFATRRTRPIGRRTRGCSISC